MPFLLGALLFIFPWSAWAAPEIKLEVEKIHGQNCKVQAVWRAVESGQLLSFSGFQSEAQDQARTACQVVSSLTPPQGQRVRLRIEDFRGKSVGEGSLVSVVLSMIPSKGRPVEAKIEPKEAGEFDFKGNGLIKPNASNQLVSECGKPTQFMTKAAVFYRGKSQDKELSLETVQLSVNLEPC